ncbi:MAG: hypothetical protein J1F35_05570 [Erysipelotrichales bacterium]|nr:hypothetical protein [Erysipelotrichales bacterium]
MSMIKYALSGSFKNFNNKLNEVSIKTNKSKASLMFDFLRCFLITGAGYSDFLNYKLYGRKNSEIKEYATIKTQDKFYEIVSPSAYKDFFSIKANFLKNFAKYIDRNSFYEGSLDELKEFLKSTPEFMYKPVNGLAGRAVKKMLAKDIKDIDTFYNEVKKNNIMLETYVHQHESVASFAPNSVNTIRVMTFCYDGESEIVMAIMRFGNGIADIDNFHKGGVAVLVDIETGKLIGNAYDKNADVYEIHPYSKKKFDGYQIPNWEIIKKTCLEAAKVNKNIHMIGWDVAVLDKGCTFIEGNRRAGWDLPQVLCDRGRKDLMNYCLDKINKKEGTNYKV